MRKEWASDFIREKGVENHAIGGATDKSPEHLVHRWSRPSVLLEGGLGI